MNSTLSSERKNEAYLLTLRDCATRYIVGWVASFSCDQAQWQAVLDYSDGSPTYLAFLDHRGIHLAFTDKS
jgi:hypothetical protein